MRNPHKVAAAEAHALAQPEAYDPVANLVAFGFRGCLIGWRDRSSAARAAVARRYVGMFGLVQARTLLTELEPWTSCAYRTACRPIELEALDCATAISGDERLAVSIVAAAQHGVCPVMEACAAALLHSPNVAPMLVGARRFATALMQADQVLEPWSISSAAEFPALNAQMH